MIKIFRHIRLRLLTQASSDKVRQSMIKENRASKYFLYAIGEIVLVVIGILIALQINISNENRKHRKIEITYLENIKSDLKLNLTSLEMFTAERVKSIKATDSIMAYFNGEKELDLLAFNRHCVIVMVWFPFEQHDNTYQELLNSGNLSIITNKDIKEHMQNIQTNFKRVAFIESEMQQDFEQYLYDPFFTTADLQTALKSFGDGNVSLDSNNVRTLLNNQAFKNGFILSSFNSESLIAEYTSIVETTHSLIRVIDEELIK